MEANNIDRVHTTKELADALRWHNESVRRAIREGRIKAITLSRTYRIPGAEFRRVLAQGVPTPSAMHVKAVGIA